MSRFSAAARQADTRRLPVVEGVTVRVGTPAASDELEADLARVLADQLGGDWDIHRRGTWLDATPRTTTPPPLDRTWDTVRSLMQLPGVEYAEPLLLLRAPGADAQEANARLRIWGMPYSRETRERLNEESASYNWSLQHMRVEPAWDRWRQAHGGESAHQPGHGIRIAHPDTGYTDHHQTSAIWDGRGKNFVERDRPDDARADLSLTGPLQFPGHGTGTASVISSPTGEIDPGGDVIGVAPGARVRPLRVSNTVIHLSFHNLILALEEAIDDGAHVVSMSLGGPHAPEALRDVVRRALDSGIIMVAAAGNYLPTVMFPAAQPGVIACAASNALRIPWRFSGFGDEIVITAPGEGIWRAASELGADGKPVFRVGRGEGTSHATAAVAGVAALWLSFHGRDNLLEKYGKPLLPYAFQLLLRRTADDSPSFIDNGRGGFGAGIANAEALLQVAFRDLPSLAQVRKFQRTVLDRDDSSLINLTLRELARLFRVPTRPLDGAPHLAVNRPDSPGTPDTDAVRQMVHDLLGQDPDDPALVRELSALIGSRPVLHRTSLATAQHIDLGRQRDPSAADAQQSEADKHRLRMLSAVRQQLLQLPLSHALRQRLEAAQEAQREVTPAALPVDDVLRRYTPAAPEVRRLRAFAFDPGLATRPDTASINTITIPVPFERDLAAGPVGEYLEVVDVDPATGCAYPPVDLNQAALLAKDGLPCSEGNPQFHQQMVYAVAMNTIRHFELALGRPIFWSSLRPWRGGNDALIADMDTSFDGQADQRDQFIQRLRLYPHALRDANAYYDPAKRAVLFGYFPARSDNPGETYPGGMVFTCLSHDIIAHEITHAILDGMHMYFIEPTNPDVFAFHEAFADIVALFQHFTYREVLRDQIARTRGNLTSENLLGQLAWQFGTATGRQHALRDAIGGVARSIERPGDARAMLNEADERREESVTPAGEQARGAPAAPSPPRWMRYQPNPFLLPMVEEAHARGAILVAAVFDAFLTIYSRRVADLSRIATGGSGILPEGQLHPDLVNRMAKEAAKSADHVLRMCIRAMDYVPPVDITFGEFLRALITADFDLFPDDNLRYRIAFIDAFRKWGIYPRDVRTLSEESLRWHSPQATYLFPLPDVRRSRYVRETEQRLRRAAQDWRPDANRAAVFESLQEAQALLNGYLRGAKAQAPGPDWLRQLLVGIDVNRSFSVANLRPARRIGLQNEFLTEMVFEVVQPAREAAHHELPMRGAVTVIVRLDDWRVRYCIYKRRVDANGAMNEDRRRRQLAFEQRYRAAMSAAAFGAAEYRCEDITTLSLRRSTDRDQIRASSCLCREQRTSRAGLLPAAGPFALLHRGRE